MDTKEPRRSFRLPYIVRVVRARPRLFLSALCGVVVLFLLPNELRTSTQLLLAWDFGVIIYLMLAFVMMANADIGRIKRRAALQDEGQSAILTLTAAAALASLGAIFAELSATR